MCFKDVKRCKSCHLFSKCSYNLRHVDLSPSAPRRPCPLWQLRPVAGKELVCSWSWGDQHAQRLGSSRQWYAMICNDSLMYWGSTSDTIIFLGLEVPEGGPASKKQQHVGWCRAVLYCHVFVGVIDHQFSCPLAMNWAYTSIHDWKLSATF